MLFFSHSLCACKVHCLLNVAIGFNLLWLIAKIRLNSLQLPSFPQLAGILSTFKSKKKKTGNLMLESIENIIISYICLSKDKAFTAEHFVYFEVFH